MKGAKGKYKNSYNKINVKVMELFRVTRLPLRINKYTLDKIFQIKLESARI